MVIKIKLYGELREKVPHLRNDFGIPGTINIEKDNLQTVLDILHKFNIKQDEISHVFINNKYSGIKKKVKDGDRIGLFPKRMGIIFVEIMNE